MDLFESSNEFRLSIIWVKLARCFDDFITYYLLKVIPNKSENQTERENPD